jgi:hypothetical protein
MPKCFLVLFFLLVGSVAFGRQRGDDSVYVSLRPHGHRHHVRPPFSYIGFSTGINNPCGILGLDYELPVKKYFSLGAGLGFSSWGNKLHLEGKYYLDKHQRGWALVAGLGYNTGVYNFKTHLRTVGGGKQQVTFNLQPVGTYFVGAAKYWRIGRKYNRFFINAGWDIPLMPPHYDMVGGGPLTESSTTYMNRRSPGGLMLGFGCSFGLHH